MTQEVDEFLTDPDADKADKLTLAQKLEAWDEIKKEDSAYNEESAQYAQLRGATEEYLEHLKSSDIDEMSAADLEGVRSLMAYSSLRGDIASRLSGQLEYAEKKIAIDNYLADIEANYPNVADEVPYMDAYLKRQLDNDYDRNSEVMGGIDGRKDVLDVIDMAEHEYNGVSVPLPEELQETVNNFRTTSRQMFDQQYDEIMETVLADALGAEAASNAEIIKMMDYAMTFSRDEEGNYVGEVGEWINSVNATRASNGLISLDDIYEADGTNVIDDEELTDDNSAFVSEDEELTDAAAVDPHDDYVVDGDPIPDLTTEDVKSENRLAVEAYLATLDPTAEGFEDYKEVMLNFADDKEVSDVLKNMTGAQQFIQKRADRAGVPDLVLEQEDTLKNAGQQAIEKQGTVLLKAGLSDNIEDVKAFDDFMKAFGKDNGEETDPLVAATKSLREAVDEDRANTGKMSVKEAVFLANTSEEELKKRDARVDSLFNSAEMQDLLANDADMKQFETFYDNVEIDSKDNITNEWRKLQDMPSDVSDWWSSKKSKETTAPATTTDGTSGAEGEAPEEEITDDEKKKHKLTGAEVRKDIYDLAVAKAMRDIMQDEALGQEDELSEEQKRALREKLKEKIAGYMMESTMSILTTQFAQNTYVDETGKKLDEKGQQAKRAEVAQNLFGQVVADPTAAGKVHISETSVGATLGAQMSPLTDFKNKLENKIGECKLVQRIKELDTRFEKKYGFWYKAGKNIAKTAIVNYTLGLPGLAVKTAIETGKAVKKFNDEYQQQKQAGGHQSIWQYMAHNKVKTLTVVASGIGAGVSAYLGVDAGLSGHFGAVGDWIKGGAETAQAAAAQGASLIEKLTDYGKKAYDAAGNILSGNTHETTTLAGAKMLRASVALSAGFGAAVNSWSKGKWKEGWAAFGGSALGAMMTMVSNEIQAENMANMPTPENTGSGVNSGTETGGAILKTNPNGLGADPNQFKLDTPKIDGMPETPEETIAKAQETLNHANNPDFERVKPGLNGGRVDIGAKAPKIELDPDVEKVINDPNAVPQVPEDYQGNGGKGGGQTTVQDDQQQEQQEQQEQQTVIDEEQNDFVEVPEERLAVELDEPKEVRVDDVPEEGSEKYKEMKIEAASNGAALEVTTPDGKSVEFVSAINEETGLRRSVMVTRDAEGNVVSEQEMSDKEARRLARQLAKTDARVNGDVSDTAEKAYKTIKHASSTELHHAKPVVELQQNEDGSQFSLSRGRNGLSGSFTQDNGEPAKYSIIKSKLGGKTTVHYVVTEDNGHQRMMTDAERDKITKQIEETGDKKSIKKLHQFGKKLEYNTNEPQYTASENEIGFRRGNTNIKMTLDENGRAQYTAMQNGKLRPATPEEIKMLKEHAGDKMPKSGTSVQSEAAKASGLSDDAKLMNRVLASEATEKFATEKLGLDEKSLKIGVATDADGNVQASVAVSNNGALYQKGGNTTYAVLNEHKQIEAYTITNGQSQKMDLQSTAKFVGALPKDKIDANSDFGKAINNTVATASRAQSMQRA